MTLCAPADIVTLNRWASEAYAEIETVHNLMSFHDPRSELSSLNQGAHLHPVHVHAYTLAVLQCALDISERTDGVFDVCVGGKLQSLGLLPGSRNQGQTGGYRDIELRPDSSVKFHRELCLDFGGIAKGFAVDRAVETLAEHQPYFACVNAGGDLRVWGTGGLVNIRNPANPGRDSYTLEMKQPAVATSAHYFQPLTRSGKHVNAIVHPDSRSTEHLPASVSVFAPTCMVADALTKVVMLVDSDTSAKTLVHYEASAVTMDDTRNEHGQATPPIL